VAIGTIGSGTAFSNTNNRISQRVNRSNGPSGPAASNSFGGSGGAFMRSGGDNIAGLLSPQGGTQQLAPGGLPYSSQLRLTPANPGGARSGYNPNPLYGISQPGTQEYQTAVYAGAGLSPQGLNTSQQASYDQLWANMQTMLGNPTVQNALNDIGEQQAQAGDFFGEQVAFLNEGLADDQRLNELSKLEQEFAALDNERRLAVQNGDLARLAELEAIAGQRYGIRLEGLDAALKSAKREKRQTMRATGNQRAARGSFLSTGRNEEDQRTKSDFQDTRGNIGRERQNANLAFREEKLGFQSQREAAQANRDFLKDQSEMFGISTEKLDIALNQLQTQYGINKGEIRQAWNAAKLSGDDQQIAVITELVAQAFDMTDIQQSPELFQMLVDSGVGALQ